MGDFQSEQIAEMGGLCLARPGVLPRLRFRKRGLRLVFAATDPLPGLLIAWASKAAALIALSTIICLAVAWVGLRSKQARANALVQGEPDRRARPLSRISFSANR